MLIKLFYLTKDLILYNFDSNMVQMLTYLYSVHSVVLFNLNYYSRQELLDVQLKKKLNTPFIKERQK